MLCEGCREEGVVVRVVGRKVLCEGCREEGVV